MNASNTDPSHYHENETLFRAAVLRTADESGFATELVEKDYFCSLVLSVLFQGDAPNLVFKGGTCLSKVYADFYRLSEDLDFVIAITPPTSRAERSAAAKPLKRVLEELPRSIPGVHMVVPLAGHHASRQYIGSASYRSCLTGDLSPLKIEIGLREAVLRPVETRPIKTLLRDPYSEQEVLPAFPGSVLSLDEAYAEKVRAALTRREPAIRDFYDVAHAVRDMRLDVHNAGFLELVADKLGVSGNDPVDVSVQRKELLEAQLETQLRSVLRQDDFSRFDLDEAFELVRGVAGQIKM